MREHAWQPSKFDTDPNEFRLGTIKDILTGEDVLEVEVEEPVHVKWTPAEEPTAAPTDKAEAADADKPETAPETAPETGQSTYRKADRKQRRRKADK